MSITQRAFSGKPDVQAMITLPAAFPADNLHIVDLPYRFSSWALDDPGNVGLWTNAEGHLLAWAVMQTPFWTVDVVCHPHASHVLPDILAWVDARARQMLESETGLPCWFVMTFAGQTSRIRALKEAGFASQADVGEDSWSKVLMRRPAQAPVTAYSLPEDFTIRPLADEREVDAYVALHRAVFESRSMTAEWRARTLRCPEHIPDTDLVIVAPDGRLAGFCIGWLNRDVTGEAVGHIEPLGVHADFRGQGLGRAVLSECLRRLYRRGARYILIETDNYRAAALDLYESVGFHLIQDVLVFRKEYANV
jgi:ribosomal protein S18 acetylase RimI-like enzyme